MNLRITSRLLGQLMLSLAVMEVIPLIWAAYYNEIHVVYAFIASILINMAIGGFLVYIARGTKEEIFRREALFVVGAGWLLAGLTGALPFVLSGELVYHDAVFETISGFTTTGASILTDIEGMSRGLLFWRSFTHWLGGMGIIVLFIAVLPRLGIGGKHMYRVEAPGPASEGLRPKIRDTAILLWRIYLGISIAEILALMFTGMGLFDSLCHTFGTMATGGFSTKAASIGHYQNPELYSFGVGLSVDLIIIVFMFLAGANFSLYYQALRGKWLFFKDMEFKVYSAVLLVSILVIAIALLGHSHYIHLGDALRDAAFQVTSITTTTGYATADFDSWPTVARTLLISLMFMGACAGSTGGGMKVVRWIILVKWAYRSVIHSFKPQTVMHIKIGSLAVDRDVEGQVVGFAIIFIGVFAVGTLLISAFGHDLTTSFSSVIACLSNIGPGLSLVGPTVNYAFFSPFEKMFLAWCMLVGRLEVYAMLVAFAPGFWKK